VKSRDLDWIGLVERVCIEGNKNKGRLSRILNKGKKGRAPRMWIDWVGVIGYGVRVLVGLD
jgi:hypothetical protein